MNLRALLVLLVAIIWFLLGGVTNWVCSDCRSDQSKGTGAPKLITQGAMGVMPLSFDWSSSTPASEAKLTEFLASLENYNGEDSLVITGPYFPGETTPDGFANLGLARAQSVKDLLIQKLNSGEISIPNFDPNKVILRARKFALEGDPENAAFQGADLAVIPPSIALSPIAFNWDDPRPSTDARLGAYFDRLLGSYQGTDSLVITGYFFAEEQTPDGFANMGLARASQIKDLLMDYLASGANPKLQVDPNLVALRGALLASSENARKFPFTGSPILDFAELAPQSTLPDIEGKAIVYFPYNSTDRIPDDQFDRYLQDLVEVLLKSEASLSVYGHTDSIGGEAYNQGLGQNRAEVVKQMLIERGVEGARIKAYSKGYTEPASTNSTEKGRQLNRRAELIIQQ